MIKDLIKKLKRENIEFEDVNFLAGDASDRKYFLIKQGKQTNVLMLDTDKQNLAKFLKISKFLKDYVCIPTIIGNFKDSGILILENFNRTKFSEILSKSNQRKLYKIAVDALVNVHRNIVHKNIPRYTTKIFFEESNIFFEWYLKIPKTKSNEIKIQFNSVFKDYLKKAFLVPNVFIHRDYHVDNLFFLKNKTNHYRCGWIDYQDALVGPCTYDLMSLTQDARVDVDSKLENFIVNYYLKKFENLNKEDFIFSYSVLAIQRHLKVLGIFSRLSVRDKKKKYLDHIPRVLRMLESNLKAKKFLPLYQILKYSMDLK